MRIAGVSKDGDVRKSSGGQQAGSVCPLTLSTSSRKRPFGSNRIRKLFLIITCRMPPLHYGEKESRSRDEPVGVERHATAHESSIACFHPITISKVLSDQTWHALPPHDMGYLPT